MKKGKSILFAVLILVIAAVYYYFALPVINIHSPGLWIFCILLILAITFVRSLSKMNSGADQADNKHGVKLGIGLAVLVVLIFAVAEVISSPIVNADKYQKLLKVEKRNYTQDIKETDFSNVPLLDKDSATILGNRKMGSIVEYVSQFEVSDLYSQINYQGKPYRVTPLVYASPIKWLTNQSQGIPAYIMIDMATQETTLKKLDHPIRYSQSEYFNRNINRHLRFKYPTYMFAELSFEIDDEGTPYWICPVKKFNVGLFGGTTIGRVVLCNAITGECKDYDIKDCPQWVDRAYPASMLIDLYDYHGKLANGFINSIFGQKGCLTTTDGYNYLAMDDDVWVYTGITSVSSDKSNVGFVLMNQRTMETRYYEVNGAEEYSAMDSAKGQVQNLGYKATFPLLVNVGGQPTYFMALKDDAGLVKKYAMVNISQYQNVAIGDTVSECKSQYEVLMSKNNNGSEQNKEAEKKNKTIRGKIEKIAQCVIDGNSHFYVKLKNSSLIFDFPITDYVQIIKYNNGDQIQISYLDEGKEICSVTGMK